MRKGTHDVAFLVTDDNSAVWGISLGWDFVAEHEWGIADLNSAFGIHGEPRRTTDVPDLAGADIRTVTKVPPGLKLFNRKHASYLMYSPSIASYRTGKPITYSSRELDNIVWLGKDTCLASAWRGSAFCIRVSKHTCSGTQDGPGDHTTLQTLYQAFLRKDAMLFLGSVNARQRNPFARSSLMVAIRSMTPESLLVRLRKADVERLDLADAVARTEAESGLQELLRKSGKAYYALAPAWSTTLTSTKNGEIKTIYPVIFFLNPVEQKKYNDGWYTVEQLLAWADNKGPVMGR